MALELQLFRYLLWLDLIPLQPVSRLLTGVNSQS
jgi:hypothetical protein